MFCKKCGKELPDNACFCTFCGYQTSNYIPEEEKIIQPIYVPQPIYTQQPVQPYSYSMQPSSEVRTKNDPILSDKERGIIFFTGFIYIIVGVITAIFASSDSLSLLYQFGDLKAVLVISVILGICICLVFGIGIIMKKRWAALTVRVFMIIGIVSNLASLNFLFVQIDSLGGDLSNNYAPILLTLLNIAYNIGMIVLTSIIAKLLSDNVQYYRQRSLNSEQANAQNDSSTQADWICKKCGARNNSESISCKHCGSYK